VNTPWRQRGVAHREACLVGGRIVAIVRKRLGLDASLYRNLQVLSITLFEKRRFAGLQECYAQSDLLGSGNQLILLNF
jgi:hypothetical protein